MARRKGKWLSGVLGPLVLKVVDDQQYVSTRVAKGTLKKTEEMIKASATFGMASMLAGKIRRGFQIYIDKLQDRDSSGRLTGNVFQLLKQVRDPETQFYSFTNDTFEDLVNFDFNAHSPQKKWLLAQPEIKFEKSEVQISWPEEKVRSMVKFPAQATVCKISMAMICFRLEDGYRSYMPVSRHLFVNKEQQISQAQDFSIPVPDGCLVLLGIFQYYYTSTGNNGRMLNHKKLSPAAICAATITPGEYLEEDKFRWVLMDKPKFDTGRDSGFSI
jgi:hypothetical protein